MGVCPLICSYSRKPLQWMETQFLIGGIPPSMMLLPWSEQVLSVSLMQCPTLIGQYQILKGIERIEAQGSEVQHIESEAIIEGGRDLQGQLCARP
ncbi:hypothetical protein Tco_1191792 [Tanacetum coccineum]